MADDKKYLPFVITMHEAAQGSLPLRGMRSVHMETAYVISYEYGKAVKESAMNERILVVDDEAAIRMALKRAFQRENMQVREASGGRAALDLLSQENFDVVILDVMMGDMDGYALLQQIRSKGILAPVLMLSGRSDEVSQVLGLGLGADDYLTKPFQLAVLIQKVKALIRRNQVYSRDRQMTREAGPFSFDMKKLECAKNGVPLPFTARELALFRFFMEHPGQVFTREQLYRQVWNENVVDDNTIMVYIRRIREKIEDDSRNPVYLKTVRGIGYVFHAE